MEPEIENENDIRELISDTYGIRLDSWLSGKVDELSRSYIQKLIEEGSITVNGKVVKVNHKLRVGDRIALNVPKPKKLEITAEDINIDVIYEDKDIIVINKPKGMVVHPAAGNYSGTLVNALMKHCSDTLSDINGIIRPGIVHRIDKDTSGVLVIAKNNMAHEFLSEKLKKHDINRIYIAVVEGVIPEEKGRIDAPIGRHPVDRKKMAVNIKNSRHAITHFKVLERYKNATLVEMKLETGRTHQIRVHMSYIGYPLVGDEVYGRKSNSFGVTGQALHARLLGFIHPATGKYMEFEAEIPLYFNELVTALRKESNNKYI
jgi:pseudouridine synthase, RluA family